MSNPTFRDTVLKFWKLPVSERRRVTETLNLLSDVEKYLPEMTRYRIAFDWARASNKVPELTQLIEDAYKEV